jgi:threonine dehydrogenase-like Zn-dependent dehydrogenase
MQALVWHGGTRIELEELSGPRPRPAEVVFEVELAGICGSDLHAYRGHAGPRQPPLILGHEAVGKVGHLPGRFTVFPLMTCGDCRLCRSGQENLCKRRRLLGLDLPGVFATHVVVPESALLALPDGLDPRLAVLVEPLAASLSAWRIDGVVPSDSVLVMGGGPIGLLAVWLCVRRGAEVTCVEPVAERRALAKSFGAAAVLASAAEVTSAAADYALDAVGVEDTWRGAIAGVRPGGRVTLVGLGQAEGVMPAAEMVRRGISVRGHYAYTRRDFQGALDFLATNPLPLEWLTVMELGEGAEAFRRLVEQPSSVTKVLFSTA